MSQQTPRHTHTDANNFFSSVPGTLKLKSASPLTLSITKRAPCLNNTFFPTVSSWLMCKNYGQPVASTFLKIHGFLRQSLNKTSRMAARVFLHCHWFLRYGLLYPG